MLPVFTVKKNRVSGRERSVIIPILPDVGMDALGAAIDFLVDEKEWATSGNGRIKCPLYPDNQFLREELIHRIEDDNREEEVYDLMQACWDNIEAKLTVKRKSRWE
jgi:hypothetical protein